MARKNAGTVMFSLRRSLGSWPFLFGVIAVLAAPCSAMAQGKKDDAKPVVAVVSVKTPPTFAGDRAAVETSVAKGLEAAGWKVLSLAETTRLVGDNKTLLQCSGEVCAVQLARVTKAYYMVWAEAIENRRKYTISLKLFDAANAGKPMAKERDECAAKELASKMALAAELAGREAIMILDELAHPDVVPGGKGPQVAVVSVKLPPAVIDDREGIESGLARGLELAGWEVLNISETTRMIGDRKDLRDCVSETCTAESARLTKVPYLVRAAVKMGKNKFTYNLSLFDAANPGKTLAREDQECVDLAPDCPPVANKIDQVARELGRKGIKLVVRDTGTQPAPVAAAPTSTIPPAAGDPNAPPPTNLIGPAADEASPPHSSALRIAGWAALGGGVALLGASAVFFLYNGKQTDCQDTAAGNRCFKRYDGKPGGYILGGVGLASALVGGYILLFPASSHPTTVALTSRGFLVGGEF